MKVMSLKEAVQSFQGVLTNVQLGKILGVSTDQVYKYASGHTATCKDSVVDRFYDDLEILIDYYESEEQYLKLRRLRDATEKTPN